MRKSQRSAELLTNFYWQVLSQFGFDRESMRVLTPREMIELYVGEENIDADHIDFKKALDLLDFVNLDEEEKEVIWLHIWCRSIMKNTWTDIDKDNPVESVRDTVFFRLVEFAFMQGRDSQQSFSLLNSIPRSGLRPV